MISLPFLWAKSIIERGVNLNVIWLYFLEVVLLDFVQSRAPYRCCSIVCLRFQVVQIKPVDWKMNAKNVINYN